ncbi:hypothetical protein ABLE68_18445 [Nocardioides sp. CN2-186]|uniref:hypothetical protein n=1 Tax=Nocardioides tweenelious TaxID=3156607 RepID=UPI0032B3FBD5
MSRHTERSTYGTLDHEYVAKLRATTVDQDAPFLMLNLMRYRDVADYPPGHPDAGSGRSGREADDLYAPVAILHDLGAEILFFGDVADQLAGETPWDRVAVVGYPSVRSFIDMQDRPDFLERHVHKEAGMLETIIAVARPISGSVAGASRVLVELLGPDARPVPGPGRLVLAVDGTPVGDGRTWSTVVVTALPDDAPAVASTRVTSAAALLVEPLVQELP